jgi:hypothetical protein
VARGRIKDVIGTKRFVKFFERLNESDPRKRELIEAFKTLKENCLRGNRIPQKLWPQIYVQNYHITNLLRFSLHSGWRMLYTISNEKDGFVVIILEALSHNDYEKRFGY